MNMCFNNVCEHKWDNGQYIKENKDLTTKHSKMCLCGKDCPSYPCKEMKEATEKTETTLKIGIKIIHPAIKTATGYEFVKDKNGKKTTQIIIGTLQEINGLGTIEESNEEIDDDIEEWAKTEREVGGDATTPQEL